MVNAPATMSASKAADCYGCAIGHAKVVVDAIQAFPRALAEGVPTWLRLHPLLRLTLRMLYGHPKAQ